MPCKPFANLFQVAKRGRQLRQKDVEIRKTPGNRGARLQCPIACRTGCAPWIQTGLARTPVLRKDLALGLHRIRRKRAWGDGSAWRKRGRARGLDGDWRTTGSPPVGTVLLQSHLPTQAALKEREGHIARTGAQRAYTMRLNPPRLRMSTSMSRGDGGVAQEPFVVRDEIVRLGASCRRDHRVVQSFVEVMA